MTQIRIWHDPKSTEALHWVGNIEGYTAYFLEPIFWFFTLNNLSPTWIYPQERKSSTHLTCITWTYSQERKSFVHLFYMDISSREEELHTHTNLFGTEYTITNTLTCRQFKHIFERGKASYIQLMWIYSWKRKNSARLICNTQEFGIASTTWKALHQAGTKRWLQPILVHSNMEKCTSALFGSKTHD